MSGFRREFDYYLTLVGTRWLENKEYRTNLVMGFLSNFTMILSYVIFFGIIGELFLAQYGLGFRDYLLFFCLIAMGSFLWRFTANRTFYQLLLKGDLNKALTMPINPYIYQIPMALRGSLMAFCVFWFIALIVVILLWHVTIYLLLGFVTFMLGFIFQTAILSFIFSLAFFMKKSEFIFSLYYHELNHVVEGFTPVPFLDSKLALLMVSIPSAVYGFVTLMTIKGDLSFLMNTIMVCIIGSLFFGTLTYINWRIGLKKYEAYG